MTLVGDCCTVFKPSKHHLKAISPAQAPNRELPVNSNIKTRPSARHLRNLVNWQTGPMSRRTPKHGEQWSEGHQNRTVGSLLEPLRWLCGIAACCPHTFARALDGRQPQQGGSAVSPSDALHSFALKIAGPTLEGQPLLPSCHTKCL